MIRQNATCERQPVSQIRRMSRLWQQICFYVSVLIAIAYSLAPAETLQLKLCGQQPKNARRWLTPIDTRSFSSPEQIWVCWYLQRKIFPPHLLSRWFLLYSSEMSCMILYITTKSKWRQVEWKFYLLTFCRQSCLRENVKNFYLVKVNK